VQVGFGSATITPPLPVVLAGFGSRTGAVHEVHDHLEVQAVVFSDGSLTTCLLVLDLLLLGEDVAATVRAAVAGALGLPRSHVLTSSVHTHSGPAAGVDLSRAGWPVPGGYPELLSRACAAAAQQALAGRQSAALAYARRPLPPGLGRNRRDLPYHPTMGLLVARAPDGRVLGTIGNVGIHPVALGPTCRAVSADWVGTYRAHLRAATQAPAVLLMGAMGDVDPEGFSHDALVAGGDWALAERVGTGVAEAVAALLPAASDLPDELVVLPTRALRPRAGLSLMTVLARTAGRRVPLELHEWSIGGVRLVSVPGEPFDALGREVLAAREERALLAAISPAWHGYLPRPFRSGYEERMSGGRRFVAQVAHALATPP
jgi:hypothetical protein